MHAMKKPAILSAPPVETSIGKQTYQGNFLSACSQYRSHLSTILRSYLDFVQTWPRQKLHSVEWWRDEMLRWQMIVLEKSSWKVHVEVRFCRTFLNVYHTTLILFKTAHAEITDLLLAFNILDSAPFLDCGITHCWF